MAHNDKQLELERESEKGLLNNRLAGCEVTTAVRTSSVKTSKRALDAAKQDRCPAKNLRSCVGLDLLRLERETAVRLRNEGRINDEVLRNLERELDLSETRLAHPASG